MTDFTARTGVTLVDGYGFTETNFVIGATVDDRQPGAMGRIRAGFQATVADEHDNPLPPGTPGELLPVRTSPSPSPPAISAAPNGQSRPGATCGSTPATGSPSMPTGIFASSTA
jgi:acyl-coenzyme A synthetase/AMP-(fatty) acid ligase